MKYRCLAIATAILVGCQGCQPASTTLTLATTTSTRDSGLLDEPLVIAVGEMGRTPRFQNRGQEDGRDHWTYCFPCVLAGAGISGGTTFGESDKDAGYSLTQPVSPDDLAATIYHALGIDHEIRVPDQQGRPVQLVEGTPQSKWFA